MCGAPGAGIPQQSISAQAAPEILPTISYSIQFYQPTIYYPSSPISIAHTITNTGTEPVTVTIAQDRASAIQYILRDALGSSVEAPALAAGENAAPSSAATQSVELLPSDTFTFTDSISDVYGTLPSAQYLLGAEITVLAQLTSTDTAADVTVDTTADAATDADAVADAAADTPADAAIDTLADTTAPAAPIAPATLTTPYPLRFYINEERATADASTGAAAPESMMMASSIGQNLPESPQQVVTDMLDALLAGELQRYFSRFDIEGLYRLSTQDNTQLSREQQATELIEFRTTLSTGDSLVGTFGDDIIDYDIISTFSNDAGSSVRARLIYDKGSGERALIVTYILAKNQNTWSVADYAVRFVSNI